MKVGLARGVSERGRAGVVSSSWATSPSISAWVGAGKTRVVKEGAERRRGAYVRRAGEWRARRAGGRPGGLSVVRT